MSGKKAFLDTNLFIYLIEENELYLDKKTPDAVQLASAVYAKAELFVSNDDRLSRFESNGCRVVLLRDF